MSGIGVGSIIVLILFLIVLWRSEERRVGKECL